LIDNIMSKNTAPEKSSRLSSVTIVSGIAILLTFLLPAFGGRLFNINWGMTQTATLPNGLYITWLILTALTLALLLFGRQQDILTSAMSKLLWNSSYSVYRWVLLLALLAVFVIFRFDAHLYGNSYIRIANFAQKSKAIFHWYDYGGTTLPYLFYALFKTLGITKITSATLGYQTASFLSGGLFTILTYKTASILHDNPTRRTNFFLMVMLSGTMLFFFGLVENTIFMPTLAALMILFAAKLIKTGPSTGKFTAMLGFAAIGVFTNILFLTVIPAVIYAGIVSAGKRDGALQRFGITISGLIMIAGLIFVYITAGGNVFLEDKLLYLTGKQPLPTYSLFSLPHLADLLNLLVAIIPLFLLFITAALFYPRSKGHRDISTFFAVLAIGQLLLLFVLDPKNGMIREIPMFAGLLTGFIFWGAYRLSDIDETEPNTSRWQHRLALPALLLILPTLIVHLAPTLTVKRLDAFLEKNEFKYESALLAMRDYYLTNEEYDLADKREQSLRGKVPGYLKSQMVNDLYAHGRYTEALEYAERLIERHPYNASYHMQYGNVLKYFKRYRDADRELLTALQLDPDNAELYHFLSELYRETRNGEKCLAAIQSGLELEPDNMLLLVDLTGFHYLKRDYQTTDSLIRVIMDIDPDEPYAYMYRGLIAERAGRRQHAITAFQKFIELDEYLPEVPRIRERIERLSPNTPDSTAEN